MTLSRRMAWMILATLVSLASLCIAALWGLKGLHGRFVSTREEYSELRMLQAIQVHATAANFLLKTSPPDVSRIASELESALKSIENYIAFQDTQVDADEHDQMRELRGARAAQDGLEDALAGLSSSTRPAEPGRVAAVLDSVLHEAGQLADVSDEFVARAQQQTTTQFWHAVQLIGALSLIILLGNIGLNLWLYRGVIRPLRKLQERVRALASGRFDERLDEVGDDEFRALASDFNLMASELSGLYRELEEKVRIKSKELVRSERLASVGYLAAGVAHEINNPMNIISAHAELLLRRLEGSNGRQSPGELRETLEIVREEAFRCKGITQKLLSLARGGNDGHELVSLSRLVADVVSMISVLPICHDRRLVMRLPEGDELELEANGSELKQVLLNLTANALEAVPVGTGVVLIEVSRRNGLLELIVRDNGRGMNSQTLERVFEPFYSDRRGGAERGTGLGLSITHAIIQAHGGTMEAWSDGVGRGSVFTVRLPARAPEQATHEGPA